MQHQVNRYGKEDLDEFKVLIETKLEKATEQVEKMKSQMDDLRDGDDDHGTDISDDSNSASQLELLSSMLGRQQKHLIDLKNALLRIQNKSYGICSATGELIDKRRLLAVPTTTKSLAGKNMQAAPPEKKERPVVKNKPKTITKIIKKVNPNAEAGKKKVEILFDEDDEDDDNLDLDDDLLDDDNFAGEETDDYVDPDTLSDDDLD